MDHMVCMHICGGQAVEWSRVLCCFRSEVTETCQQKWEDIEQRTAAAASLEARWWSLNSEFVCCQHNEMLSGFEVMAISSLKSVSKASWVWPSRIWICSVFICIIERKVFYCEANICLIKHRSTCHSLLYVLHSYRHIKHFFYASFTGSCKLNIFQKTLWFKNNYPSALIIILRMVLTFLFFNGRKYQRESEFMLNTSKI